MHNISQITYISIRKLLAKKTLYFLFFLLIIITAGLGARLYNITAQSGDVQILLARKAEVLTDLLGVWGQFTVFFVIIYAAVAIYNDLKNKSIVGVMAKPISRTEFLLGRWLGAVTFFTIFILFGTALTLLFMYLWGIPVTFLFITGIVNKIGIIFVFAAIAFVLSLFAPPAVGGGFAFTLFMFHDKIPMLMDSSNEWIETLGYILFYSTPAVVSDELIAIGIMDNMLDPSFGLYWSAIIENFSYAGLLLFAGILLYKQKDITLD